ncbi:hypothetical protein EXM99_08295 [Clostridium botulinum]|nr:hypothetical protein [Clostridium botulinum]NFF13753.1 hypothetical protein [Clostridium botulinum]
MIENCLRCQNEHMKENFKYCPICGIKLETAQEVPVQEQSINVNISDPLSVITQKVNSKMKNLVFDL